MSDIRRAIKEDRLDEFRNEFYAKRVNNQEKGKVRALY
jgi:queuine/archaeosine tRNA-ribosyltransferase